MQLPYFMEQKQLGDLDGVVWFRKTIDLLQTMPAKRQYLS
jgi:hypothetical protein